VKLDGMECGKKGYIYSLMINPLKCFPLPLRFGLPKFQKETTMHEDALHGEINLSQKGLARP
jgi:hypothetical protein